MTYSFDGDLASWLRDQGIGDVYEAVMIDKLRWWVRKSEANDRHFYEGRYWCYNSLRALEKLFPFWSKRQIERIVNKLRDAKLIATGQFAKDPNDKTLFYTVLEENIKPLLLSPNGECLSPNGDSTPSPNGDNPSPNGEILYEQSFTHIAADKQEANKLPSPRAIMDEYNTICTSLRPCIRLTDKRSKAVRDLLRKGFTPEQLTDAFHRVQRSAFCTGKGQRGWIADFDWLLTENNLVKVLEGKYNDDKSAAPSGKTEERKPRKWLK